jgi:hypothetical protein
MLDEFVVPYIGEAVKRVDCAKSCSQRLQLTSGVLHVRTMAGVDGRDVFVPVAYADRAGNGSVRFTDTDLLLRLRASEGYVALTADRLILPGRDPQPWSEDAARAFTELLLDDGALQTAWLATHRNLFAATAEYAAVTGTAPAGSLDGGFAGAWANAGATLAGSTQLTRMECTREAIYGDVVTTMGEWVVTIRSAADQVIECGAACLRLPPLDAIGCVVNCGVQLFLDIVSGTWNMVTTTVRDIIGYMVTCQREPSRYPTPGGKLDVRPYAELQPGEVVGSGTVAVAGVRPFDVSDETITKALEPFTQLFDCFLDGRWRLDRLEHLGLEVEAFRDVPFGVSVCLDRACADKLKNALLLGLLGDLGAVIEALLAAGAEGTAIVAALAANPKVAAIAAVLGIDAALIAAALIVMLVVLAYQALVVLGQLAIGDIFGSNPNGACLHYPLLAIGALALFHPIAAAVIAANFPIIVTGF